MPQQLIDDWSSKEMPETEDEGGNRGRGLEKMVIDNPLRLALPVESSAFEATGAAYGASPTGWVGICKSCMKMFKEVCKRVKRGFTAAACSEVKRFRRRIISKERQSFPNDCFVCVRLPEGRDIASNQRRPGIDSALTRCWKDDLLRGPFTAAFSERSGISPADVRELMRGAHETTVVCNLHKQLVRRTIDAVTLFLSNRTCAIPHCDVSQGVRPFRVREDDMTTLEMDDACSIIFDGVSLEQLRGKRICAGHRSALNRKSDASTLQCAFFAVPATCSCFEMHCIIHRWL